MMGTAIARKKTVLYSIFLSRGTQGKQFVLFSSFSLDQRQAKNYDSLFILFFCSQCPLYSIVQVDEWESKIHCH